MDRRELRRLKERLAAIEESIEHCEQNVMRMQGIRKDIKCRILNRCNHEEEPPLRRLKD